MVGARIEISGMEETFAVIGGIASRLEERTPLWRAIGLELYEQTYERFETSTGPDGNKWPPSWRVKNGQGPLTLVLSGDLRRDLILNVHEDGGELGSNTKYAAIHQWGGVIRAKTEKGLYWNYRSKGANADSHARKMEVTIPARPFLGYNEESKPRVLAKAEEYLLLGGEA